ncbi:acyltransferase family protein [Chryseosolibacter indicus]|uniref:Acyltransferase n=1 Tax=Chryseosolibacter indicus TaxID=2782351 RepID=A0ABS5VSR5_9BACT|nr:acyltransferase [Chryseosolibacter indicus]MBT1704472.1 acyltransferase [Chryseosolibacter indicus]
MEKRVYFKNLNALRFFAATAVIIHHVEQYKNWANLPNIWGNTTIDAIGHKAVSFFFVLSGFLITYLLLAEKAKTDEINIRNFYIRRILRIWPLYYLIVALCLFVVPLISSHSMFGPSVVETNFTLITVLLLFVLPNVVRTFAPSIVGGNQLWSIGVEEQFYLVWPLFVRWFINHMVVFLIAFIMLKLGLTVLLQSLITPESNAYYHKFFRLWVLLQVEQMAIGALGAYILFKKKKIILNLIYHPITLVFSTGLFIILFIIPTESWLINYYEALVFIILILNISTNPAISLSLENKAFSVLGNISYGIYMYHTLCIAFCMYVLRLFKLGQSNHILFNVLLYSFSVIVTIAVAYLSYELFEKKFLELKERFMIVKSGEKADTTTFESSRPVVSTNGQSV